MSLPGGDTELVGNFEWRIPLFGPVSLAPFFDVGITTILRPSQLRLTRANLDSLRTAFPQAQLGDNLQIADDTNGQVRTSSGVELVVNVPIVQAPFRIYWAYNLTRVDTLITPPPPSFRVPPGSNLPPGVLDQLLPTLQTQTQRLRFTEDLKTVRFTISRTF